MIGPQHDESKHPVTGRDMTDEEINVPGGAGEVTRVVSDKRGRVVIVYRDGHLLTREMQGSDAVWRTMTPQVSLRPAPLQINGDTVFEYEAVTES